MGPAVPWRAPRTPRLGGIMPGSVAAAPPHPTRNNLGVASGSTRGHAPPAFGAHPLKDGPEGRRSGEFLSRAIAALLARSRQPKQRQSFGLSPRHAPQPPHRSAKPTARQDRRRHPRWRAEKTASPSSQSKPPSGVLPDASAARPASLISCLSCREDGIRRHYIW
jgi:hypothetical protein